MSDIADQANNQNDESKRGLPEIELFIKASPVSRDDKGPCPISQQWFMAFYVLAEKQLVNLYVTVVNPDAPTDSYAELEVRRLPVARVISGTDPDGRDLTGAVFDTNDEIEMLVDLWKCPSLALPKDSKEEGLAEKSFYDLYKNLNLLLKTNNANPLMNCLRKIELFLSSRPYRFLIADEITFADCMLMPKLHHVNMAAKFYRDFTIPSELQKLHEYLSDTYRCEAFRISCPADRDLLCLYLEKVPRDLQVRLSQHPSLMDDRRSMIDDISDNSYNDNNDNSNGNSYNDNNDNNNGNDNPNDDAEAAAAVEAIAQAVNGN